MTQSVSAAEVRAAGGLDKWASKAAQSPETTEGIMNFRLNTTPTAQARARTTVRGKFATTYKTGKQKDNERTIEALLAPHAPNSPRNGPLVLEFVAALPWPRSASKKRLKSICDGFELPTKKPDLDNLAKQLKDAMTRLQFWHDDAQVVCLRCEKIYAETGYWEVAVYEAIQSPAGAGQG